MMSRAFCIVLLSIGLCFDPSAGSWWSTPEETTPSTTEDAECDWSLDNEMAVDGTDSSATVSVTGQGNGYAPQTQSNGYYDGNTYPAQSSGNLPTGNAYTTAEQNAAYQTQQQNAAYQTQQQNAAYQTQPAAYGGQVTYTGNGYTGGGGVVSGTGYTSGGAVSGNGYVSSNYYTSPQSQQGIFKAKRQTFAYINENDYVGLHPRYPIGSFVQVTNPDGWEPKSVLVQIVGRPKELGFGRCLTLSKAAFAAIADLDDGVTHCIVTLT